MLSAAPQVLAFPRYLPVENAGLETVSSILALIALAWSLLILSQAVAVAHEVSQRQAGKYIAVTALAFLVLIPYISILPVALVLALIFS